VGLALRARLLWPLSLIWRGVTAYRLRHGAFARVGVPVICVGNLSVGGTGKTPVVSALLQRLRGRGLEVAALSRGYGGALPGPVQVDPARHAAGEVGDEPLLLTGFGPAWIARDRLAGARAMAAAGVQGIVLDDGFQNPALAKDLSILVVDAATGFGNGRILPAGPLREAPASGLARADLVILMGDGPMPEPVAASGLPVLRAALAPLATGMPWAGLRCLAFAGIGRPEKFFASLRSLGADLRATRAFPDHATYSDTILQRLSREAQALGAQLVTTEKDAVRLPEAFRPRVLTLPVRLELEDWGPLDAALDRCFGPADAPVRVSPPGRRPD